MKLTIELEPAYAEFLKAYAGQTRQTPEGIINLAMHSSLWHLCLKLFYLGLWHGSLEFPECWDEEKRAEGQKVLEGIRQAARATEKLRRKKGPDEG